jgi:transcriptional regulator with XRE-family HTH domain
MEELASLREISGMSQFAVAQKSGIPRVRLSLAETGQLLLRAEERNRVRNVLIRNIEARAAQLQAVLTEARNQNFHESIR